jgi:FixJ family two-component response regulator
MNSHYRIGLVDDDAAMRRALGRLLALEGYQVITWSSAEELLADPGETKPDCLILDVRMPGMDGLQLQERLSSTAPHIPVIFLTGKGDIPMTVRAIKGGAVNFLTKPVVDKELFAAIHTALEIRSERMKAEHSLDTARRLHQTLTPREREVLTHIITGKLNKQIAARLGTSEQTIKVHRMRLMEKLGTRSVAELVRLADILGIQPAPPH